MANDKLNHATGGFVAVPRSIMKMLTEGKLSKDGLMLYTYLTYRIHNERQVAFPTYATMAKDLKSSRRFISETLKELEELGLVRKHKRANT